jgi:hypothetical protein
MEESRWLVNTFHNMHLVCKGQSCADMNLGEGATICFSNKQKIKTKSAGESELVGVDDIVSTMILSLYFIQDQG